MKKFTITTILLLIFIIPLFIYVLGQDDIKITITPKMKAQPNFNGKHFENNLPTTITTPGTTMSTLRRWLTAKNTKPDRKFSFIADSISPIPQSDTALNVMWIGHSTLFIEIDGMRFLTDPIWSDNNAPYIKWNPMSFLWPERFYKAPVNQKGLHKIDGVLISHDHSDHLDYKTIKQISKTSVKFYVPLGAGQYLTSWGIDTNQINEYGWWDSIQIGLNHKLICTPSRHFSGRTSFSREKDRTLWCSWVIKGKKHTVFFSGDSGPSPNFKTIGDKFGPFDISFLEIGASDPNWPEVHLGPQNAIHAGIDLKSRIIFPIHWGLFDLAIHEWDRPVKDIIVLSKDKNVTITLPRPGQFIKSDKLVVNSRWWE